MDDAVRCPGRGARAVPVLYGMPGPEAVGWERDGRVLLGGCIEHDNAACGCGARWRVPHDAGRRHLGSS